MARAGSTLEKVRARAILAADAADGQHVLLADSNSTIAHRDAAKDLRALREEGVVEELLEAEETYLLEELQRFADTAGTATALEIGLKGVAEAQAMVPIVRDREAYQRVDAVYRADANRRGGVPLDDARRFFASHIAWLGNETRTRKPPGEKDALAARLANMRAAERLYRGLQMRALGLRRAGQARGGGRER